MELWHRRTACVFTAGTAVPQEPKAHPPIGSVSTGVVPLALPA